MFCLLLSVKKKKKKCLVHAEYKSQMQYNLNSNFLYCLLLNVIWRPTNLDLPHSVTRCRIKILQKEKQTKNRCIFFYSSACLQDLLDSLAEKGHEREPSDRFAVVQSIHKMKEDIYAYSDARKGGKADGF